MSFNPFLSVRNFLVGALIRVLPLAIMGSLTLFSFWFLEKNTQREVANPPIIKTHVPDYVFTNVKLTVLNPNGTTKYRLLGKEFKHYEDDASIDIKKPRLRLFNPKTPPLTIVSETGQVSGDLAIVELFTRAVVSRPDQLGSTGVVLNPHLRLSSNYLKVFINDDRMTTNVPIEIIRGDSVMTATKGAVYDNIDQSVSMFGDVKGYIAASDMNQKN